MNGDLQTQTGRLIAGEEEARRRIARELHDDHCQRLAALALELKAVRGQHADGDSRGAALDALGRSLAGLAEDLRDLSHDLHPAVLERQGLAEALHDHCAEVERRSGLEVRLSLRDGAEDPLPPAYVLGLYRIVQEALVNTVHHAGARTVHVTLGIAAGEAHLAMLDDGAGFDPDAARRAGGLGLAIVEERARLLGGRCRITSAPGAGTEIEVTVPLPKAEPTALVRLARRHRRLAVSAALVILALAGGLTATPSRPSGPRGRRRGPTRRRVSWKTCSRPRTRGRRRGRRSPPASSCGAAPNASAGSCPGQPLLRARLLDTLGGIHTQLGLYDEARPLLAEALAIRERLRGPDHPEVAETLVRLGALARLSGKEDAVPLFRRALAIRVASLGPETPEVAEVLNDLGTALAVQGRLDEAETTLRRALALQERLWGGRDRRVAKTLHNLSGVALYRGRLDDSERLLRRALAIREAVLPADDLDLAGSREALALLLRKRGRPAEAAALLERLAATAEKVYGPAHPELAKTLLNLGLVRADLGDDEAARRLFERALAIDERSLDPGHPQLIRALAVLADLHFEHGRYAEAEPLYRRLMALHGRGAKYEDWDSSLANWARLLRDTGRGDEAARVR